MEKQTTAQRLRSIMEQRGLKQIDVIRLAEPYCNKHRIKLGKSDMSQFVSGKVTPGQWKLSILSMALDVSESWLMGFDVPMERESNKDEFSNNGAPVSKDERTDEVIRLFDALDREHQETLLQVLRGLLADQKTGHDSQNQAD